jgi:Flp pilus assembly protein TadG
VRLCDRRREGERGAAVVEFGLILPLLLLILGGLIDLGFFFNAQVSLTHAAREGVRVESIRPNQGSGAAAAAYTALRAPLTGVIRTTPVCPAAPSPTDRARIEVAAEYDFIILPFGTRTLTGEAVMRCGG